MSVSDKNQAELIELFEEQEQVMIMVYMKNSWSIGSNPEWRITRRNIP